MASAMLAHALASAVDSEWALSALARLPVQIRRHLIAGEDLGEAVELIARLCSTGRAVTVRHLAPLPRDLDQARANANEFHDIVETLTELGLATQRTADISVDLHALGLALPDGSSLALELTHEIARAAEAAGSGIIIETAPHTPAGQESPVLEAEELVERARVVHDSVRTEVPGTAIALQARLARSLGDCADLAGEDGARVRVSRGVMGLGEPPEEHDLDAADQALARCMAILMRGTCYPMILSHDPRIVDITGALAMRSRRRAPDFEYQMLLGMQPEEQIEIADRGDQLRVYVPYGEQWPAHLLSRVAEYPGDVLSFLRGVRRAGLMI